MSEHLSNQIGESKFGFARIENKISGCFTENYLLLEFRFDDSEHVAVKIFKDNTETEFLIEKSCVETYLNQIIFLGRKTEVRSQSAWTTVRYAKVEWQNLDFAEEKSGLINRFSNEWTIEEMEEYLPKVKDANLAEEIRETLAKGLHRRAIEIHSETERFIKQISSSV